MNRRPDFITADFIIEVKNHQELFYSGRDADEIQAYAVAAHELGIPLWVFVRTDTPVDLRLEEIVGATGGRVVRYLRVPEQVDIVGRVAWCGLFTSLLILFLIGRWSIRRQPTTSPSPT